MHNAMPQLESPPAGALYDYEADTDLRLPRRRPVADWGADDLFHNTPRRRRSTTSSVARERRLSGPAGGKGTVTPIAEARSYVPDAPADEWDADQALQRIRAERAKEEPEVAATIAPLLADPAAPRTASISGRPEPPVVRSPRRRPPRTVEERMAHRPDRVAAWAVGLGFLLIVLAILSA
jgi:hypothetical protein